MDMDEICVYCKYYDPSVGSKCSHDQVTDRDADCHARGLRYIELTFDIGPRRDFCMADSVRVRGHECVHEAMLQKIEDWLTGMLLYAQDHESGASDPGSVKYYKGMHKGLWNLSHYINKLKNDTK